MIRFVDLRGAKISGYRFAFWNTVNDRFQLFDGEQAWNTWEAFEESYLYVCNDSGRYRSLCPPWVFSPGESGLRVPSYEELEHKVVAMRKQMDSLQSRNDALKRRVRTESADREAAEKYLAASRDSSASLVEFPFICDACGQPTKGNGCPGCPAR